MLKAGRFIVVEGLEGAGKTTAIQTIRQYLESMSYKVIITREPGGTVIGEQLRHIIKTKVDGEMLEPCAELLIMYAARVQLLEQVIKPALAKGIWVIADRFELSTYAYQGAGRGINKQIIDNLSAICLSSFKPDWLLFLDISPEQGLERVQQRGSKDRIEQESLDFFNRVHQGYQQMINTMPYSQVVDASQSVDVVQDTIRQQLASFLNHNVSI